MDTGDRTIQPLVNFLFGTFVGASYFLLASMAFTTRYDNSPPFLRLALFGIEVRP
jgi:hypothetical protein